MSKKRMRTSLTALLLTMVMVISACSGGAKTAKSTGTPAPEATKAAATKDPIETLAPGTFPIVKEKVTLKVMVPSNAFVENFETNEFTKWYEEKTNVHIEWQVVPEKSKDEKLNLVLAGGEYPDIIMNFGVSPAQQMIYGQQGVFLPLNDLIDKNSLQFKKIMQENTFVKNVVTAPDGNIYALPDINDCYHCSMSQKMWINEKWLKKLDLKMPTTTDELYTVLKAFKEKDPNGNNKADEIPLTGAPKNWRSTVDAFIMNSFIFNPIYNSKTKHMFVNQGKVDVAYNKPEWKDGLTYLNKLYSEGLIDPQIFTQDDSQILKLGENPGDAIVGASMGGHQGVFTQLDGESGRWLDYKTVPALKGPSGTQIAAYDPFGYTLGSLLITKNTKYPEVALRWADGLYNEEESLRSTVGRPDIEWTKGKDGEVGINGKPAKFKKIIDFGQVQNVHWDQAGPTYRSNELRLSEAVGEDKNNLEVILYNETKQNYEPYKAKDDMILPPLFFTNEQAAEIADLYKTLNDYVDEMMARFITGDADLNKDWDTYVKTLDNMNLKRFLEIYQVSYASQKK